MLSLLVAAWLLAATVACIPSPQSLGSSLSIVTDNDLEGPNSPAALPGVIVLHGKHSSNSAKAACEALGERLWPGGSVSDKTGNFQRLLGSIQGQDPGEEAVFWIEEPALGSARVVNTRGDVVAVAGEDSRLPALCTQSAPFSNDTFHDTSERWQTRVSVNNESLVGYRDRTSFRFLGVRYAPNPPKLAHSTAYRGTGGTRTALDHGPWCIQADLGEADCLFLDIYTTSLTGPSSSSSLSSPRLKPVMFYIHGGGFLTGYGSDPNFDGGNLASRGDVVVVTINYRIGPLGFLALADGVTNGNYGLGDMVLALDWVREHIAAFGGDGGRITLFGQSAGANAIRALLGSPRAKGKFKGAAMLSLCGGIGFCGLLQRHYPIAEAVEMVSHRAVEAANCTDAASQVECLRALDAREIWWAGADARFLVIDGEYITADERSLFNASSGATPAGDVHILMGIAAEDGLPLISYPALPPNATPDDPTWLTAQGLPAPRPDLFPVDAALQNQTLATYKMWARLATDAMFRCSAQSTLYAGLRTGVFGRKVYYYEFERTYQPPEWPGLNICEAPKTPAHPDGDVRSPDGNLRCHNGEPLYVFGNLARRGFAPRDEWDRVFERYVLDSFASFARTYDPNPDRAFLEARGYQSTLDLLKRGGPWRPAVRGDEAQVKIFDVPPGSGSGDLMRGFKDVEQCEWLQVPLEYWMPRARPDRL